MRSNHDGNLAEGSTVANPWSFSISFSPSGSPAPVTIVATEASGRICASNVAVPDGTTSVTVVEDASRVGMDWLRDATVPVAYPRAQVSGSLSLAEFSTTNGSSGSINLPNGTTGTLTLDYFNASGRRVQLCKQVTDNGQARANQGGNWSVRLVPNVGSTITLGINGVTEGNTVCAPQSVDLNLDAATLRPFDPSWFANFAQTQVLGWPRFSLVATSTNTELYAGVTGYNVQTNTQTAASPSAAVSITAVAGDLKLTVNNRPQVTRTIKFCKKVTDAASTAGLGTFRLVAFKMSSLSNSTVASTFSQALLNASQLETFVCSDQTLNEAALNVRMAEVLYSAGWTGNATGYPQIEFRNYDDTANPAISKSAALTDASLNEVTWMIKVSNTLPANSALPPQGMVMDDPLPALSTFVSGSVACVPSSPSVIITSCDFDTPVDPTKVHVEATLPFGESVTITVRTRTNLGQRRVQNVASASFRSTAVVVTAATATQALPALRAVPALSGWMMLLLTSGLALIGLGAMARGIGARRG